MRDQLDEVNRATLCRSVPVNAYATARPSAKPARRRGDRPGQRRSPLAWERDQTAPTGDHVRARQFTVIATGDREGRAGVG